MAQTGLTYDPEGEAQAPGFCAVALELAGVALVPGEAFGSRNHLRLSYATSTELIDKGLDKLEKLLNA